MDIELAQALKEIADLKAQIEKMKNCRNCKNEKIEGACGHFTQVGWCKNWELSEWEIKEKMTIEMYEDVMNHLQIDKYRELIIKQDQKITELEKACDETQELLDKQIEATYKLDKENAELKDCFKIAKDNEYEYQSLFTKAKDHIKKLLDCLKQDTNDPQTNYYVCQYMDKAEQFLKDSEVEK